ncbi:LPXTG cell wall anchor domain-containing protein, partial [Schaalia hyovaginalis]|nr:LPXTG cell wall anchor domain-containing protein [Schaalia hyovaginalis]
TGTDAQALLALAGAAMLLGGSAAAIARSRKRA